MIDNSKRFRRILSFRGRATRLEYNVIIGVLVLLWGVMAYLMFISPTWHYKITHSDLFMPVFIGAILVTLYVGYAAAFRRRHDLGLKGFSATSMFGRECVFEKGIDTFNEYGSDPLQEYEPQLERLNEMVAELRRKKAQEAEKTDEGK